MPSDTTLKPVSKCTAHNLHCGYPYCVGKSCFEDRVNFRATAPTPPDPRDAKIAALEVEVARWQQETEGVRVISTGRAETIKRLETETHDLAKENDVLRGLLARGNKDCVYCNLPAAEISRCARGFPGCGRMDDIVAIDAARTAIKEPP